MSRDQARQERLKRAVDESFLGRLPDRVADELIADALYLEVPAGGIVIGMRMLRAAG